MALRSGAVLLLLLGACGRLAFDELAPPASDAASGCGALPDGTSCDDGNICTASSTCQAGSCSSPVQEPCTVAESQPEFDDTAQGARGWSYGYWHEAADPNATYDVDTDFVEMAKLDGLWRPPDFNPDMASPEFSWCYLAAFGGHPDGTSRKFPVLRWTSDVTGRARVTVAHRKSDTSGGDGTRATLYLDGIKQWSHVVEGTDGVGVTEPVDVELAVGRVVDLVLDPVTDDARDTTELGLTVSSR